MSLVSLSIPEEFLLMVLNDQTGYFYEVGGWTFKCAVAGAILADLSLRSRIDTDLDSLYLLSDKETGDPILDKCLEEISSTTKTHEPQYWVERLTIYAEEFVDLALKRLVHENLLTHHPGDFYSTNMEEMYGHEVMPNRYVKDRVSEAIFFDIIPAPREIMIVNLLNVCDVIRFIFDIEKKHEERIELVCNMELLGQSISKAVKQIIVSPSLQRTARKRKIPTASLIKLLTNRHLRDRNIPALIARVADHYGPVFKLRSPSGKSIVILAGTQANRWVHRNGRKFLTSGNYFREMEKECGASGLITSLDGADHFRLRKVLQNVYSPANAQARVHDMYTLTRQFMKDFKWGKGTEFEASRISRLLINLQMSKIVVGIDSQDIFEELVKWKEAAAKSYVGKLTPKFSLRLRPMRRRFQLIQTYLRRIEQSHTPFQRIDQIRDLADDLISLHASDPQFLPEQNMPFMLVAAQILQSIYLGDVLSFSLYELSRRPEIAAQIRDEANAFFENEDDAKNEFELSNADITHRFLLECLRIYPVVPMQLRHVANSCAFDDFHLPLGQPVAVVQTAAHYMEDSFPDPYSFDIDRYLPGRDEQRGHGFAPYGLGTHMCVGYRWMEVQLAVTVLTIARHFELAVPSKGYKLKISPFPTMSVDPKLKLRLVNQICEVPV